MAASSLGDIKKERGIWPMLPIRLAVMPVIVWLFMHLVTKDVSLINICTIGAGMPVASLVAMGAHRIRGRASQLPSVWQSLTIVSLVTIPIMAVLLGA